jgi:hypothetical protein
LLDEDIACEFRWQMEVPEWTEAVRIAQHDPRMKIRLHRKEFTRALPGNVGRFKAWGKGVKATIVNGQPIVLDGVLTGRLAGQIASPG